MRPRRWFNYGTVSCSIVLLLGGVAEYAFLKARRDAVMTANFNVDYPSPPTGWRNRPHGPQTLFLYEQPQKGLVIRGGLNQMLSDVNPTPDLDRDNLAQLMIDNTVSNMPGWTAEKKDVVQSRGTTFRLVKRAQHGLVIVTAFAVKGNTTMLVSISARDAQTAQVDKDMGEFHEFLSKINFTKADTSKW